MDRTKRGGQIVIECPSTIFHLYVNNQEEISKIDIFMRNIRSVKRLGINDIYNWCNRQNIAYKTTFHYHKESSIWRNMQSYYHYSRQKLKYRAKLSTI